MAAALSALLIQALPYLAPLILGLVGLAAGALWRWILTRVKSATARSALETLGAKAKIIVEGLEQSQRPLLAAAAADGKLDSAEKAALLSSALRELLELAGREVGILKGAGGLSTAQTERVASLALEAAVLKLPHRPGRIGSGGSMVATMTGQR